MNINSYWTLILLWPFLNVRSVNTRKIEWLPTSSHVIKNITSNGIFCHAGTPKTIEKLWWTLEIHVKVISGKVILYAGGSPEAIFDNNKHSIEAGSKFHALNIDPFNTSCVAVNLTENFDNKHANHSKYDIQVLLTSVDLWRVKFMAAGIIVIFASAFLSLNPVVFYLCVSILVPIFLLVPILHFVCLRSPTGVGVNLVRWSTLYDEASIFIAIFALGITYIVLCIRKRNGKELCSEKTLPLSNKDMW